MYKVGNLNKLLTFVKQKPKYTWSRNQRHDSNGVAGIGWTEEGFAKFNELYDRVVEDRKNRGAAFNQELLNQREHCYVTAKF